MENKSELIIRRSIPDSYDYTIFAGLINAQEATTVTAAALHDFDRNLIDGDILERYAVCLDDQVIGYGGLFRGATSQKPIANMHIIIDANYQGKKHGSSVYEYLLARAIQLGATAFEGRCQDDNPIALAFAKSRGFSIRRHIWESELDLEQFDLSVWIDLLDNIKTTGIRFSSLAAEGNTDDALRKLYDLNASTALDNPSTDGTYQQTFENWKAKIANSYWFRPDGQLLAIDGSRYVGLGAIGIEDDRVTARNAFTGVDRDYRGRKIAIALKVLGAQFAKEQRAKRLVTTNDSQNAPMLTVNRKLAYRRTRGSYWLIKSP